MKRILISLWYFLLFWRPLPLFVEGEEHPLLLEKGDRLNIKKEHITPLDSLLIQLRGIEVIYK